MNFDQEQTQAINAVGSNILVSASAGAGKTGVLVARLQKRCVKDRIDLSRILAMTFTAAAAAEMKKRLASQLHGMFENAIDLDEKQWLSDQLIALESAYITTIDSFCLTIIRKYCNVIGLDPAIATNILDEGTQTIMRKEAFHEALSVFYASYPQETIDLLRYFSLRSEDYDALYNLTEKINLAANAGMDPEGWYAQARDSYKTIKRLNDMDPVILDGFFGYLSLECKKCSSILDAMEYHGKDDPKVDLELIAKKKNALVNCLNALQEHDYATYGNALEGLHFLKTSASGKNEAYKKERDKLNKQVKSMLEEHFDSDMLVQDNNELTMICRNLVDLAKLSHDLFQEAKKQKVCMDFGDMERYAFEILKKNDGVVAKILRDSLDEIMVDEFQDTSELQNAIIEMISKGNNVFRVGDVKQSIYRFRQAKPQLMRSLMEDENTLQITLRHNYRSKQSIVAFTNLLFQRLMNIPGSKDTYEERDTVSIGASYQVEEPVPVEFIMLDNPKNKSDEETNDEEGPSSAKDAKASYIAARILQMKKEDPSLRFGSFAVLVKAHADKAPLRSAFDAYGIPYEIDAREGFFQSELCQVVLSLVRFICDESDTISLAAVLASELYGFSDQYLATLKINHNTLLDGIKEEHPEIFEECHRLREIARNESICAFLNEVAKLHGFFNKLDEKQQANFDYLFEKAINTDMPSLHAFLAIMEAGETEKSSEAMSKGKDDDVVTVTTIHQSKGLQYGVVFLWSSNQNYFADTREALIIQDSLIGMKHISFPYLGRRTTVQRLAVEYAAGLEDIEEYVRLLYVAVTRAQARLIIVDIEKEDPPVVTMTQGILSLRKGFSGLILRALENGPLFVRCHDATDYTKDEIQATKKYVNELPVLSFQPEIFTPLAKPSENEMTRLAPLELMNKSSRRHGTYIHEVIENLPNRTWTMDDFKDLALTKGDRKRLLEFSHSDLYHRSLAMEIHKEYPFYVETASLRISGTMDFVAISSDTIILVDFKTDHAEPEELQLRYSDQINTYRKALRVLFPGKNIEAYAWSFHDNCAVEIEEEE